jgi:multidrug efflux pump subunit AcrA (membrane-fusion protein)
VIYLFYHHCDVWKGKEKEMKLSKLAMIILVLYIVSIFLSACASQAETATGGQTVAVQRGDLTIDITGVGNLALSQKVDLAFEMDGTVQEVLVQEAQSVEEGQVLARLDTSAWEELLTTLEDQVTAAERNVTAKQRAVTTAERKVTDAEQNVTAKERAVTTAERQVTSKKLDLLQAQINLNNAKLSLEQTEEASTDRLEIEAKELQVEIAQGKLEDAQIALDEAATEGIDDAKQAVEDAKTALEDAKIAVEDAEIAVTDAQKALDDDQKALDDAKNASPEVKAPFAGFITKVNVAGGDEVKKGTVAVTIADPTKFEAEIMVSEANILEVTLGEFASVQVEAMPGVSLPAKVTQKAPSATIQSGVVNYQVKVELTSLQPITTQQQPATAATGNVTHGIPSERFGQAFGSGNLTQEQISQMRQQRQSATAATGNTTPGASSRQFGQAFGSGNLTQEQINQAAPTQSVQLAEGMTVTVSITTSQKNNVLLVPVQAVISRGGETFVQVLNESVTEERPVQVGISNWQYAEITSGLSEGEQVIIPLGTSAPETEPSTQQRQRSQPGGIQDIQRMLR